MKKLTTIDFVNRAILKHQNKYNYDKVNYVNIDSKVIITCGTHGDFKQIPANHLNGSGCVECNRKKKTSQEFVEKANKTHNYKFNYDKVVYVNSYTKVIITCKKHGDFQQLPANHLKGFGCSECSGLKKKTSQKFIEEANKIHNYKFNYDKVAYVNSNTKVVITCEKHGDFEQIPGDHLRGFGCMECGGKTQKDTQRFVFEANKIHNYKFNYDKVVYVKSSRKVIITCKEHGDFQQIAAEHLKGFGCSECSGLKKKTTQKFIEEANKIHNYKFNYDKVTYVSSNRKVIITCKKHGDFEQIPNDHLNNCGCPKCKSSKGEKLIYGLLQKLDVKFETQYKFDDCINKRKLPFDFAIYINDKIKLIEFHGRQHYEFNIFFHSRTSHEEFLIRDKIKQEYAKENKIDLLIIPYNEIHNIKPL